MRFSASFRQGFTLIELLVTITIISILSLVGFVNFKDSSTDQVMVKALEQIQTQLRLAQSNATSGTLCNGSPSSAWYVTLNTTNSLEVTCNSISGTPKTFVLENVAIEVTGNSPSGCAIPKPVSIIYTSGVGKQTIYSSSATNSCLKSSIFTFTISNSQVSSATPKILKISSGGGINVQ